MGQLMWLIFTNSPALKVVLGKSTAKIIYFYFNAFEYFEHVKWAHMNRVMSKMKLLGVSVLPHPLESFIFHIFSLQTSYCCGIFTGTPRKGDRKAKFELPHLLLPKKRQKISRKCLYEEINPTKPRCSKFQ